MPDATPPFPQPPAIASASHVSPRKPRRWWLWIGGGLFAFLFVVAAAVAITLWWMQRPIKPVVLSSQEKAVVESKLQRLNPEIVVPPASSRRPAPVTNIPPPAPLYVPGGKELRITERELNGLLNQNTELGQNVRLELDTDAVNAYLAIPIPKDFPIGGGKMFRAKGRFRVLLSTNQAPVAMLEDVTVIGLSLPQEWLGGVKGKNLLADAMGQGNAGGTWNGIKSLRIVRGAIVLEVGE